MPKRKTKEHHAHAPEQGKGSDKPLLTHPSLEGIGDAFYPTEETLDTIKRWDAGTRDAQRKLMAFVKLAWWMSDWGWHDRIIPAGRAIGHSCASQVRQYSISTGGWSGNEDIIEALKGNYIFWSLCWVQARRGGHYVFEIPEVSAL